MIWSWSMVQYSSRVATCSIILLSISRSVQFCNTLCTCLAIARMGSLQSIGTKDVSEQGENTHTFMCICRCARSRLPLSRLSFPAQSYAVLQLPAASAVQATRLFGLHVTTQSDSEGCHYGSCIQTACKQREDLDKAIYL